MPTRWSICDIDPAGPGLTNVKSTPASLPTITLHMKLFRRSLVIWIALLGIVYSQLALSAYACPVLNASGAPTQIESHHDMGGMPCAGMETEDDLGLAALCVQHCDQGNQTLSSDRPVQFQPALVFLLNTLPTQASEPDGQAFALSSLMARAASPPPLWRTGRLRI